MLVNKISNGIVNREIGEGSGEGLKMDTTVVGILVLATVLGANAFLILDTSIQTQMAELNQQFNDVMDETMNFFDNAWGVAKQFQDPNYDYNPSDLGNYTAPEGQSAVTIG